MPDREFLTDLVHSVPGFLGMAVLVGLVCVAWLLALVGLIHLWDWLRAL